VRIERASELNLPEDPADAEEQPPADTSQCGQGAQVHMTMETDHELGDETFQLRTIVIGDSDSEVARNVVERVPFRVRGQERSAGGLVSGAAGLASHVFVAQAEYYYDTEWDEDRGRVHDDVDQWMWSMHWRARLRRFRLPHDDEDEESGNERESGGGQESCGFGEPNVDMQDACSATGYDGCGEVTGGGFLGDLQDLAETVMVH
jgi:hypothetical protein